MNNHISNIALLMYLDNNFVINRDDIIEKYLYAILLQTENQEHSVSEFSIEIEKYYYVHLTENEILDVLESRTNYFRKLLGEDESYFLLDKKHYKLLKEKAMSENVDEYIISFAQSNYNDESDKVQSLIWKFIFDLFVKKVDSYNHIFRNNNIGGYRNALEKLTEYTEQEKKIINEFLNFNNDDKNTAIFKIACYALEYSMFVSNVNVDDKISEVLSNKILYIDTNILYRALGINGDRRKERTLSFLKKCNELNQKLVVSHCTIKEFEESIEIHSNFIGRHNGRKVSPNVYKEVFLEGNIEGLYYKWANTRNNTSINLFKANIKTQLEALLSNYKITIDKYNYNMEGKFVERLKKDKEDIICNIHKDDFSADHDAYDLGIIGWLRKDEIFDFVDSVYFYISTDYALKLWEDQNSNYDTVPRLFYPDQWLTIMLKYSSRSSDDFKSFVSFINLSFSTKIDQRSFNNIVGGVSELTEDFELQELTIKSMINNNFNDFKGLSTHKDIVEKAKIITKYTFDQEHKNSTDLLKETEILKKDIAEKNSVIENLQIANKTTSNESSSVKEKNSNFEEKLRKKYSSEFKIKSIKYLLYIVFSIYLILCLFRVISPKFNIYTIILKLIGSDELSIGTVLILIGLFFTGSVFSVKEIKRILFNKDEEMKFVNKKLEEEI